MILARRKFLMGLGALMAAPAIVSVSNIMPVKAMPPVSILELFQQRIRNAERIMARDLSQLIYGDSAQELPNYGLSRLVDESTGSIYLRGGVGEIHRGQWKYYQASSSVIVEAA